MHRDLRLAWRSLRASPAFTATGILTLAIGIGASTAIFSIVNAVLLRPLPFQDPDRIVRLWEHTSTGADAPRLVSAARFNDWQAGAETLADMAMFAVQDEPLVLRVGTIAVQANQTYVTSNLFSLLGVRPAMGRMFDAVPSGRGPLDGSEVIVSHDLWQRAFAGDPGAIGRSVLLEGRPGSVIVGVMPPGFSFPSGTDVWTPLDSVRAARGGRRDRIYGAIARLHATASIATARHELQSIADAAPADGPDGGRTVAIMPLQDSIAGPHRLALLTLFAAVAFVMLVGCANLSNLFLARGLARRRDLAVRRALGATRARIARLLLTESLLMTSFGAVAGLALAAVLLPVLIRLAGPDVPRVGDARLSAAVFVYAAAATLFTAFAAGIVPALRLSRGDISAAFGAAGERSTRLAGETRLQRAIVAGELALCLILMVGALLFAETFIRLKSIDVGFEPAHVVSIDMRVPLYRTLAPNRWQLLARDSTAAIERLRAVPGVQAVSATSDLPLSGRMRTAEVTLQGEPRQQHARYHRVSPQYFGTMGMTLVRGRDFTDADAGGLARLPDPRKAAPSQGVVIVNETAAKAFWPGDDALGKFLSTNYDPRISRREVVGIVRDVRSEALRAAPPAEVYVPYLEDPSFAMTLLIRTQDSPDSIVPAIRTALRDVSGDLSTANVRMLDDVVRDSMGSAPLSALVVSSFAVSSLVLSTVGVFGVFAFGVAARTREIGIRIALGAAHRDIVAMFLKQAAGPICAGVTAGTAGALVLGRLIRSLLFDVTPSEPASFLAAALLLVAAATAASYLPVRRALNDSPAHSLRG
jgi:putative ABC transport system permease protein